MINKFVIVGGGTSGWITAMSLFREMENCEIYLIDKGQNDSVGVGEATLLGFDDFMSGYCEFDEKEWKKALDAVPKAGILFPGWGKASDQIWHPFYFPQIRDVPIWDALSHTGESIREYLPLYDSSMKNEVDPGDIEFMQDGKKTSSYAWHVDCGKLVTYIKNFLETHCPTFSYIEGEVGNINRWEDGSIRSLVCKHGEEIAGDVFFDCSGFKSILKDHRDKVDLKGRLFVDTAVAGHIPYLNEGDCKCNGGDNSEKHPYVSCPAVDHGWIWKIPLQSRIGSGMVFNRSITDPEEAKDYFVDYWDGRVDRDSLSIIDWTPYYDKNIWDKNVISIGLAAGFIEPLESTGVALIIEGVVKATEILRGRYFNNFDIDIYNAYLVNLFENCADFVSMHYDLSIHESKFWDYVRDTFEPSDYQRLFKDNINSPATSIVEGKPGMFGGSNWLYWMLQMGYPTSVKSEPSPLVGIKLIDDYKNHIKKMYEEIPSVPLNEYLKGVGSKSKIRIVPQN